MKRAFARNALWNAGVPAGWPSGVLAAPLSRHPKFSHPREPGGQIVRRAFARLGGADFSNLDEQIDRNMMASNLTVRLIRRRLVAMRTIPKGQTPGVVGV